MAKTETLRAQLFKCFDLVEDAKAQLALARNGPESDAIDALAKAVYELAVVVTRLKVEVVDR